MMTPEERHELADAIAVRVISDIQTLAPICRVFEADEIAGVKRALRFFGRVERTTTATIVGFVVLGLLSMIVAGIAAKFGWRMGGAS